MLDQPIPVSQGTYKWHEFTENLECYEKGGYHPVHIGQTYGNGRYEIVHKLGYGSYSTVWLARTSTSSSDFVTLKILRADASDPEHECTILTNLSSPLGTCHPGYRHIQHLLDHFYIDGPNGKHMCLVTEVLGGSIGSSKASIPWKFSPDVARAIVVQVLRGLAYIHSRGVVHADLHSGNILFKHPRFKARSVEQLYKQVGQPKKLLVERWDGQPLGPEAPQYCVPLPTLGMPSDEVIDAEVAIADFGESFSLTKTNVPKTLNTPRLLLPPEYIFNDGSPGLATDMWTVGCTIFDILGVRRIFEGLQGSEDEAVAEMFSTLGPLPGSWWKSWSGKERYFNADGSWRSVEVWGQKYTRKSRPLAERLQKIRRGTKDPVADDFSPDELAALESFSKSILKYNPGQRQTAEGALKDPWVVKYGLPSMKAVYL